MKDYPLLLTAYEKYGSVDLDDYIDMYIDEEVYIGESDISDYNEYLSENGYDIFMDWDLLEDELRYMDPIDAVKRTYFGNFNFGDDYFQYNGYGNIDSYSSYQVIDEMSKDKEFLRWYVEKYDLIDEDEAEEIIEKCNEMIKEGY